MALSSLDSHHPPGDDFDRTQMPVKMCETLIQNNEDRMSRLQMESLLSYVFLEKLLRTLQYLRKLRHVKTINCVAQKHSESHLLAI